MEKAEVHILIKKEFPQSQNIFFHTWCVVYDGSRFFQDGVKTKTKTQAEGNDWFTGAII